MRRYTLETIIVLALLLWLLGAFIYPFGGGLINLLLIVIVIVGQVWIVQAGPSMRNDTGEAPIRR